MKNLFIIRSPLQILNAYEAIAHFNLKNNVFLIVQNHLEKNNVQMREMLSMCEYEELIEMPPSKSNYFRYVVLTRKLKKYDYNFIFFGNLGSFQKLLLANLEYEKSYLLEDGTSTLVFHKELSEAKQPVSWRDMRFLLAGLNIKRKKPVAYFTIFDLERKGEEEIVQHHFGALQDAMCQDFLLTDEVYILGQNLVSAGLVSDEAYRYYIEQIKNDFKDEKIIYIPHRAEIIDEKFRAFEDENFVIFDNKMPIEFYFMQQKIKPKKIVSFFSTALFTLAKIFDTSHIRTYHICSRDLLNIKRRKKEETLIVQAALCKFTIEIQRVCYGH